MNEEISAELLGHSGALDEAITSPKGGEIDAFEFAFVVVEGLYSSQLTRHVSSSPFQGPRGLYMYALVFDSVLTPPPRGMVS